MYDEFRPVGRDYGSPAEVEVYDSSHADFRDAWLESREVLDRLALPQGAQVVDLGCGTGTFAVEAARRGLKVHAVDVSEAMLGQAREKARQAGVGTIQFHHAGFLTYGHAEEPVAAVSTTYAFHHLPDFWKGVALGRIRGMLQDGGIFHLHDVVLDPDGALENIRTFIREQEASGGSFLREDAEGHFREEFSTYDWILDGLLERAGFKIESKQMRGGVIATYFCRALPAK